MIKPPNRLSLASAILCAAFMSQTAHAERPLATVSAPDQLVTQFPDIDRESLIEQVGTLRSQLIQNKQALAEIVSNKELDSGDVLITVIMPGGLLYAGYRKVRYEQAKSALARVSADIEEFSRDLLAMQSGSTPVVVALLP